MLSKKYFLVLCNLIFFLTLTACSTTPKESSPQTDRFAEAAEENEKYSKFYEIQGKQYYIAEDERNNPQKGYASWYGKQFHGRRTASGAPFNMHEMSAAHKTLPFGTYVRITHVKNGKTIIVRINDRGPFHRGRIIDVSYAAAKKLEILQSGTGLVEVEILTPVDE